MIEYWEWTSSFDSQRKYQAEVPLVHVPNEVINQWEDWFNHDPTWLVPPVYSEAEREAVVEFDRIWNRVAEATPDPLPSLDEACRLPEWEELRAAAHRALSCFLGRGRLPEDSLVSTG